MASRKDSRTKVVLARKIEKQGLGSTPDLKQDKALCRPLMRPFDTFELMSVAAKGPEIAAPHSPNLVPETTLCETAGHTLTRYERKTGGAL